MNSGPSLPAKLSRITIALAAVAIVAVLAASLVIGVGVIRGGKTVTLVTTEYNTVAIYETQVQQVTQSILSTVSLPGVNHSTTTTTTTVSVSHSTATISTTSDLTVVQNDTVFDATTETLTTTASPGSAAIILMPQGTQISFSRGQAAITVLQDQIRPGFSGFIQISWNTINETNVHWVLQGNTVNETSLSSPEGGVEFPVQAYIPYTLTVYNDACQPFSCANAFNVTAMIVYEY